MTVEQLSLVPPRPPDPGGARRRLQAAENGDGDYYFCAATGSELGPIVASVVDTVTGSIRFVQLP